MPQVLMSFEVVCYEVSAFKVSLVTDDNEVFCVLMRLVEVLKGCSGDLSVDPCVCMRDASVMGSRRFGLRTLLY